MPNILSIFWQHPKAGQWAIVQQQLHIAAPHHQFAEGHCKNAYQCTMRAFPWLPITLRPGQSLACQIHCKDRRPS